MIIAPLCAKCMVYGYALGLKIYGVGILTGIGFTMSLFVGNLAFVDYSGNLDGVKIGGLIGSTLSAVVGYFLLLIVTIKK